MCVAVPVMMAIGTAFSVVSGLQQASTASKIAERNAKLEEYRGRYEARQLERRLRYTQGKATVGASANGIGLDGTFLDIISANEVQGEIDIENAKRNSYNRAGSIRAEGKAAAARARSGAVASLIGGTGQYLEAVA